jgi:hypothetical protein
MPMDFIIAWVRNRVEVRRTLNTVRTSRVPEEQCTCTCGTGAGRQGRRASDVGLDRLRQVLQRQDVIHQPQTLARSRSQTQLIGMTGREQNIFIRITT